MKTSFDLADLTPEQRSQLAQEMGTTSADTLRGYANGARKASSARAIEIEHAARRLGWIIHRESLNSGCAECEFAKQCRKKNL